MFVPWVSEDENANSDKGEEEFKDVVMHQSVNQI